MINVIKDLFLDVEDESSDGMDSSSLRDDGVVPVERFPRVRSRFRHYKQRTSVAIPIGIFWDIENCQVNRFIKHNTYIIVNY